MDVHHPFGRVGDPLLVAFLQRLNEKSLAVRFDFEFGILVDSEEIENRTLDDQREAVSHSRKFLFHGAPLLP